MDTETATIVLSSIAGGGFLIWLASVAFVRQTRLHEPPAAEGLSVRDFFPEEESAAGWSLGTKVVPGDSAALCSRATTALAGSGALGFGPLKIIGKSERDVSFEYVRPVTMGRQPVSWFRRGKLRFTSLGGNSTRIDYALDVKSMNGFLRAATIIQFFGLVVLVALFWVLYMFVATSEVPAVRWQSFQMFQAVHILWPPFLMTALYRNFRGQAVSGIDTFLNNLQYLDK